MKLLFALGASIALVNQAQAESLTVESAQAIINGCVVQAKVKGQSFSVVVYAPDSAPLALLRMDGNPAGTALFAMEKAKAVTIWRFSTAGMAEGVKGTPGFANAPGVVAVAGGVPIYSKDGKEFLGAAAASGEEPEDDAACADAGVKAAGFRTDRVRG